MIIHDENASEQPSPSNKSSALPLPSTGTTTRREHSQGPAPPSYSVATSSSPTSPTDTSPLLPFAHNPHTANLTHARAANLQPQYGIHFRPTQTAGYDHYAAQAAEEERIRQITRRTRRRFFKSLLIAALIYFLVMALIGSAVGGHFRAPPPTPPTAPHPPIPPRKPDQPKQPDEPQRPESPKTRPWPSPYDGDIIYCVGPESWSPNPPYVITVEDDPIVNAFNKEISVSTGGGGSSLPLSSINSFTLPVDAVEKSIFSRGRHASGNILLRAREAEEGEDEGNIKIQMQASYSYDSALASTNICALKKDNGWRGLGIYTSKDFDGSKDIRFSIDVLFPKSASFDSSPRPMGNFSSSLSWFSTTVYTVKEVSFDRLTLQTEADKIHSVGCQANMLTTYSSNGEITGEWNVTDRATFATSNSAIKIDLNMFDVEEGVSSIMRTSNAPIDANIRLYHSNSTGEIGEGGEFDVMALTKNAPVKLAFPSAPVDSILNCTASTVNAATEIHLHPTYEGSVTLMTTNGKNGMTHDDLEDPSGRGRKRVIDLEHMWKLWWLGWIGWGEKKEAGQLVVRTTNGDNMLWITEKDHD